jgi:hypothetical protein
MLEPGAKKSRAGRVSHSVTLPEYSVESGVVRLNEQMIRKGKINPSFNSESSQLMDDTPQIG